MNQNKLAPMSLTESQRKWLESEAARTGNSIASIVRGLIQEKLEAK